MDIEPTNTANSHQRKIESGRQNAPYSFKSAKFWCFVCEEEFSKLRTDSQAEMLCPKCNNITEEISEAQDNGYQHPKAFMALQNPQTQPQRPQPR